MPQLSDHDRLAIRRALIELIRAQRGAYEVPQAIQKVREDHQYDPRAVHYVIDDELEFGQLDLNNVNRLVLRTQAA
jgi:hypothetical protein